MKKQVLTNSHKKQILNENKVILEQLKQKEDKLLEIYKVSPYLQMDPNSANAILNN